MIPSTATLTADLGRRCYYRLENGDTLQVLLNRNGAVFLATVIPAEIDAAIRAAAMQDITEERML